MIRILKSGADGNAYLVGRRCLLLIEAGVSIKKLRELSGFTLRNVQGCLITHEHGDHAKAAKDVQKAGITVYCTEGTAAALNLTGHRLRIIRPREVFSVGDWRILPFPVIHDSAAPVGFLLDGEGEKIVFATDTQYIPFAFQGLTRIMIEASFSRDLLWETTRNGDRPVEACKRVVRNHLSIEACEMFLRNTDLSRLKTVHLLHLSKDNADAQEFKRRVQAITGAPVYMEGDEA